MSIQERSISTERGEIAWLEAGQGWPLVLLHGFPLNATMWRPQLEHVPPGWRFIAPDFRGFGDSKTVDPAFWMHAHNNLNIRGKRIPGKAPPATF